MSPAYKSMILLADLNLINYLLYNKICNFQMHMVSNLQYLIMNQVTLVLGRRWIEVVNTFFTFPLAVVPIG